MAYERKTTGKLNTPIEISDFDLSSPTPYHHPWVQVQLWEKLDLLSKKHKLSLGSTRRRTPLDSPPA